MCSYCVGIWGFPLFFAEVGVWDGVCDDKMMLRVPMALRNIKIIKNWKDELAAVLHPSMRAKTKREFSWLYFDTMGGRKRFLCLQLCP